MKTSRTLAIFGLLLFLTVSSTAQDATALYDEGVTLKKNGNTSDAIKKFKQAIAQRADYTDALYELGWCQNDLKDYNGAIASLRTVRKSWNTIPKVFFELGYAFDKTNQVDSAIDCYNRCIQLKPDYSLVYKQLGYIAYGKDDYTNALGQFSKYEMNAKDEIKDYLYWYRKGYMLNATKDYGNAITALRQSLSYKTDYTNTYLELGYANNKLKQGDEAIEYFKKAMELDPKSHIPYNGIGEVYRDTKKDMNEAINWYQKALGVTSKERKACFGMGYCLNSQGKYSEAAGYLKTAIEQEPTYTAAYVELGYCNYMLGNNQDAITQLNKALSLNPANENARYYSGLVYIQQKDKTMAQKMVDELKTLNSKMVPTLQTKVNGL